MQPHPQHSGPQHIPGKVHGDKLFKRVSVKNRLRSYGQGYALSLTQLAEAEARGAKIVELEERETGIRLRAGISLLRERGVRLHFPGYEAQLALALGFWTVEEPAQGNLFGRGMA